MRFVYTEAALADLEDIHQYQAEHWPLIRPQFDARLTAIERRISQMPSFAPEVAERPGVRSIPFISHPYHLFYQVTENVVEILYIHHTSRQPWYEKA